MLIELALLVLLTLFGLTILVALLYYGLFEDIEVSAGSPPMAFGSRRVAYKRQRGKYSDASALFTEVCSLVPHLNTFGIYYDDPDVTRLNKCRYIVGVLLSEDNLKAESETQLLSSKGYTSDVLPDVDHVVYSTFPFKGIISVIIAIRRVYPVIKSYIAEHNLCAHPAIEIYAESQIHFMFPLAKQDQFYELFGHEEDDSDGSVGDDSPNEARLRSDLNGDPNDNNDSNGSKSSKHSSTSSSFEELRADDSGK